MPVKVSRAGYLSYYYSRRRKRADTSLDPGLVPEGNWTALSLAQLSDQSQGGFRIQTAADDAFGMSQKSRADFTVGRVYRVRATVDIVSPSTTATLRVGTATINNAGSLIDATKTADGSWELTFTASATTLYFGLAIARAAFSADATVSDFSIDWQPIDLDELSLNDLVATAGEEWSATITGNTSGSTIVATASDGTVLTVDGTTVSGTYAAAGAKTVSLEETHPNARASRTTNIGVTVDAAPEVPSIDAPTSVTYVPDTNPPEFNMNVTWVGVGAAEIDDILYVQFDDDPGEIYPSNPVAITGTIPTFPSLPTLTAGEHSAVFWFVRNDGEVDEITGEASTPCEFEIAGVTPSISYTFLGAAETEAGVNTQTLSVDIGAEAADRYILVAASRQNGPVVAPATTAAGEALDELLYDDGTVISAYPIGFWGGFVPSGAGAQNIVVPWAAGAYEFRNIAVWRIDGLPPGAVPKEVEWTNTASVDLTIPTDAGDLLFFHQIRSSLTKDLSGSSEAPARQADITGDGNHGQSADWTVAADHAPFNIDCNLTSSVSVAVTFAGA